jgi:hypothetical protein
MTTLNYVPSGVALQLLKSDLGFFGSDLDESVTTYLTDLLYYSQRALLEQNGIVLKQDDIYDDQLCAMYAAWVYRNRATGAGKTQMLKDEIKARQLGVALAGQSEEGQHDL